MERIERKVEFDANTLINCIRYTSEVSNIVTAIYQVTKGYSADSITPLETDGMAFAFPNEKGEMNVDVGMMHRWIMRKAFEDFTVGLADSLMEACRLLKLKAITQLSRQNPYQGEEKMNAAIEEALTAYGKYHIPALLDEIEKQICISLPLKDEILSINKVRNCLVHRNGTVSANDINQQHPQSLELRYWDMAFHILTADGVVPLTKEVKESNTFVREMTAYPTSKIASFPINTKIHIDANVYKGVTYTIIVFIHNLIRLLPVPPEIRDALIQPFKINLEARQ